MKKIKNEFDYLLEFYRQMREIDKKESHAKAYKLNRKENSNGNTKHSNRN